MSGEKAHWRSLLDRPLVHLTLIIFLGFLAYSGTFDFPFHFDDGFNIVQNPLITSLDNLPAIFAGSKGPFASRPLMHATFALNYYFGGLDPRGYHIVNIALHLLNGALLYLLVFMTGRRLGHGAVGVRRAAFASAALFTLHPAQTEAVTYIVSRSMLLATAFYLLGMVLFLKAVTAERRKGLYMAGLFVASLMGMGSREDFAMFPLALLAYDLLFISGLSVRRAAGNWRAYAPVLLSAGYMAFIVMNNTYDKGSRLPGLGVPHGDYFVTQFNVHWSYLRLLLMPVNQTVDYDYPIARTLFGVPAVFAFLGYLGLWAASLLLARRAASAAFGGVWFLITLIPISFGVAFLDLRLDDVMAEHRFYLPSAGLFIAAGVWAATAVSKLRGKLRVWAVALLALVPIVFAGAAYARNAAWESEFTLWGDAVAKAPRKSRPYNNLGYAYLSKDMTFEAIGQFEAALDLDPGNAEAHYNISLAYERAGLSRKAEAHYLRAVELQPEDVDARLNLGNIYMTNGMPGLAAEQYEAALRVIPRSTKAHVNLGNALVALGRYGEAIEHFRAVLALNPMRTDVYNNLANAYYLNGQADEANEYYRKAMGR